MDKLLAPCLYIHTFLPPKKEQPLNNGQNTRPQSVHYSEVPLYFIKVSLKCKSIENAFVQEYRKCFCFSYNYFVFTKLIPTADTFTPTCWLTIATIHSMSGGKYFNVMNQFHISSLHSTQWPPSSFFTHSVTKSDLLTAPYGSGVWDPYGRRLWDPSGRFR